MRLEIRVKDDRFQGHKTLFSDQSKQREKKSCLVKQKTSEEKKMLRTGRKHGMTRKKLNNMNGREQKDLT
ncbi:uncharacterized protein K452DRAFT_283605 [Aplosporella prunicola CBS 121167]|uniref:Uncharacterized protein n=1 Tax=Aplosporella prunicola CBS 121167 TaxID=1176127 RepID=A0A6A6BSV2_9PEZI|nr:uncharacterized protein K452DRAFT_283605 [Aplosporella prunicola CBS 121167]KAF2146324.1 hypothetical protein K452DRAFT_283605 [Aplosporella prunicola CBS 121167]